MRGSPWPVGVCSEGRTRHSDQGGGKAETLPRAYRKRGKHLFLAIIQKMIKVYLYAPKRNRPPGARRPSGMGRFPLSRSASVCGPRRGCVLPVKCGMVFDGLKRGNICRICSALIFRVLFVAPIRRLIALFQLKLLLRQVGGSSATPPAPADSPTPGGPPGSSACREKFYIVETAPHSTRGRCVLPDGRVVLGVSTSEKARKAAADVEGLTVVPQSELSEPERATVRACTPPH